MSIKKNIFYNVSLSALNVLFPIVTAPYISRVLGVENVGVVRFVMTYVSLFALFAAFGISTHGLREIAKYKDSQKKCSKIFSSLLVILFCSTLVVVTFFLLSINLFPEFSEHRLLFIIYGLTIYFTPITMDWYFQAKENFRIITIRSFVVKLLALISLFIFVRERNDVMPYVLILAFSVVATHVWNLSYAFRTGLRINFRNLEVIPHLKPMSVFLCSTVAISVYVIIDVIMLGHLSSFVQVGYYTAANSVLDAIVSGCIAINMALFPRITFNNEHKDETTNRSLLQKNFDICALFAVPMVIGIFLISPRFVPLFFGNEFIGSIIPMKILSLKILIWTFNSFFVYNILLVNGHEKKFFLVTVCTAILSFFFNFLLIPRYGAIGAAIVTIAIVGCFQLGFNLYYVYKLTQTRLSLIAIKIAFLFSLPFFAIYYLCNTFIVHNIMFLFSFAFVSVIIYCALQFAAKNYLILQIVNIALNKLYIKNSNKLNKQ